MSDDMAGETQTRIELLTFLPCIVAPLSIVGSTLTLVTLARHHSAPCPVANSNRNSTRTATTIATTTTTAPATTRRWGMKRMRWDTSREADTRNNDAVSTDASGFPGVNGEDHTPDPSCTNAATVTTSQIDTLQQGSNEDNNPSGFGSRNDARAAKTTTQVAVVTRSQRRTATKAATNAAGSFTTYHRLMIAISISDIVMSIGISFGPLPMPYDRSYNNPWARGNTATCNLQGFLIKWGSASFGYNAMLMIYYVLVIRYGWKNETIQTRIEPFMLVIPALFHLATGIAGIPMETYNPSGTLCYSQAYPPGCEDTPEIDCERGGEYIKLFGIWFAFVPALVSTAIMLLSLLLVACTVLWRYYKSQRFVFHGERSDSTSNSSLWDWRRRCSGGKSQRQGPSSARRVGHRRNNSTRNMMRKQTEQVIVQCLLYGITFLNVTIWSTLGTMLTLAGYAVDPMGEDFWLLCLILVFYPIQGLFNFLIFIRPRYLTARQDNDGMSRWFALKTAIWNFGIPNGTPSSNGGRSSDIAASNESGTNSALALAGGDILMSMEFGISESNHIDSVDDVDSSPPLLSPSSRSTSNNRMLHGEASVERNGNTAPYTPDVLTELNDRKPNYTGASRKNSVSFMVGSTDTSSDLYLQATCNEESSPGEEKTTLERREEEEEEEEDLASV